MTIAPWAVGVKAAHEPNPAAALNDIPSIMTGTSVRAQARRTTPSGVVVALEPAAAPILPSSSLWGAPAFVDKLHQLDTATQKASRTPTIHFCLCCVIMKLLERDLSRDIRRNLVVRV